MKKRLLLIVASLLLSVTMFAQDFHWAGFDYHAFTQHMNVIGKAYFDGELQNNPNVEVATFVNGELRGTKYLKQVIADEYYIWGACYFNNVGETFTFKAYDHANNVEYDLCDVELVGRTDGYGSTTDPVIMNFTKTDPFGPDYPWVPSTSYSGNGMSLMAQIRIDGEPVDRNSWEVGAFCNGECRGDVTPLLDMTAQSLGYLASMTINGNDGDVINFYLYDTQAGEVFQGECPTTVVMENDGFIGQDIFNDLFVLNFLSSPFWTLDIEAYTEDGGWYLISSPLDGAAVVEEIQGMTTNNYDLFYFDQIQALEWVNYKDDENHTNVNPGFDLESGKGYLYANSSDVRLVFAGDPYEGDGSVQITNAGSNYRSAGWNLIGNPLGVTAKFETARDFYVMSDENGRTELIPAERDEIQALEGVFVFTSQSSESVKFEPADNNKADKSAERIVLNLSRGNGRVIDRVMVRMDESDMLPKYMMDETHAHVCIPQNGTEYAVVNGTDAEMFTVKFKADRLGSFTISANVEGVDLDYLHLIDYISGVDVDMLLEGSYTFIGSPSDMANRFMLRFSESGYSSVDEIFAYQNGSDIIVNGDGTLEVYDMMGRFIGSYVINGSENIQAMPMGVYIFRLVGETVKTQKIVVR